jgi:acetyl esterase
MGGLTRLFPMDYSTKLDAETQAFIDRTAEFYPADAVDRSVAEQRHVHDTMCRAFFQGYPEGVSAQDVDANNVPCRVYTAGTPSVSVVYFHGGGFVVGGLHSHDDVCAEICGLTGYRVISVDYRLSPEHIHPAAFLDAVSATQWVAETYDGNPIVLSGDSAGGNLAAAVAHHARGRVPGIVGQVLVYPLLGTPEDQGSYVTHANAPALTSDEVEYYIKVRSGGDAPTNDPTFVPMHDADFAELPPTVIITAECDPLSDEGGLYRDVIRQAGGKAHWHDEPGLVHGYLRARTTVARAADSFERIVMAIQCLGQGAWPYD